MNDKDSGCIIGNGYFKRIAENVGTFGSGDSGVYMLIRIDLKDERIRLLTAKYIGKRAVDCIGRSRTFGPYDKNNFTYKILPDYPFVNGRRGKSGIEKNPAAKAYVASWLYP